MPQKPVVDPKLPQVEFRGSASPVDTMVRMGNPSSASGASDLAEALRGLSPAIDSYIKMQETKAKTNEQMGAIHALTGKAPDAPNSFMNLGWGYGAGYSLADGESRGIKIAQEYEQALEQHNYFADDPDSKSAQRKRQALLKEISDRHIQGTTNVGVLAGASNHVTKGAMQGEAKAFEKFQEIKTGRLMQNTRVITDELVKDMRGILVNASTSGGITPEISKSLRTQLTSLKQGLQTAGLSGKQAASTIIDSFGQSIQSAVMNGSTLPSLAQDMLKLFKETDESGFNWYNAAEGKDGEQRFLYRDQIDNISRSINTAIHEGQELRTLAHKELKNTIESQLWLKIHRQDPTWRQDADAALQKGIEIPLPSMESAWKNAQSNMFANNVDKPEIYIKWQKVAGENPYLRYSDMEPDILAGVLTDESAKAFLAIARGLRGTIAAEVGASASARQAHEATITNQLKYVGNIYDSWKAENEVLIESGAAKDDPVLTGMSSKQFSRRAPIFLAEAEAYVRRFPNASREAITKWAAGKFSAYRGSRDIGTEVAPTSNVPATINTPQAQDLKDRLRARDEEKKRGKTPGSK